MAARRPSAPERVRARERASQVLKLRIAGHTVTDIAKAIGVTHGRVSQIIKASLARSHAESEADADALKTLQRERLERVMQQHAGKLHDPRSADVYLKAHALLSKLYAVDAPAKLEMTGKDGSPLMAPPPLMIAFDDTPSSTES